MRGLLYCCYTVPVMTWGAEHWAGILNYIKPLITFHHNCLRLMMSISRAKQQAERIRNDTIMRRLKVPEITAYADKRALTRLGKIGRMDDARLPRLLLFSWLDGPRKRGGSQTHFGHRARNLLVDMITTCVPDNARSEFHGSTECNRSEFTIHSEARYWKDYNNWISVAQDEAKWRHYVDEYMQMHSYLSPSNDKWTHLRFLLRTLCKLLLGASFFVLFILPLLNPSTHTLSDTVTHTQVGLT